MYERIVDIIVFVVSELKHNKPINEIDVSELEKKGYTRTEISTAVSWIVDRFELPDKFLKTEEYINKDSFRVLHDGEKDLFTTEALGEMLQLYSLGLLSNEHIEMMIEQTLTYGYSQIDSYHLKMFVAGIMFNSQTSNFPGNRVMLSGDEKIN